jgi:hypothetical protein
MTPRTVARERLRARLRRELLVAVRRELARPQTRSESGSTL